MGGREENQGQLRERIFGIGSGRLSNLIDNILEEPKSFYSTIFCMHGCIKEVMIV